MLQISEIVKKTEEMFDLFNAHFYHGAKLFGMAYFRREYLLAVPPLCVIAFRGVSAYPSMTSAMAGARIFP